MRFKSVVAKTMAEALQMIREELGDEAIIITSQVFKNDVRVTAAVEYENLPHHKGASFVQPELSNSEPPKDIYEEILEALEAHDVPGRLSDKLLRAATTVRTGQAHEALKGAIAAYFPFEPLGTQDHRPLMFVGLPGSGKTTCVAKLAARSVLNKKPVAVISVDAKKPAGIAQLEVLLNHMDLPLIVAGDEGALCKSIAALPPYTPLLIDTMSINPFDEEERQKLANMIEASGAVPVLVMPGGGDIQECIKITGIFKELGAAQMLMTRMDVMYRLGSMIASAHASQLPLTSMTFSHHIAQGLASFDAASLATLLLSSPGKGIARLMLNDDQRIENDHSHAA